MAILFLAFVVIYIAGTSDHNIRKTSNYSLWFVQRNSTESVFGYVDYAYSTPNTSQHTDTALFRSILNRLVEQPEKTELKSVFPENTEVRSVYLNNTTLRINFSTEYNKMSEYEKALAKYCIAKTFSVFDSISEISISVEGKPSEQGGTYSIENYITDPSQLSPATTEITYYRLSPNRSGLSAKREEVIWYPHNSLPHQIIDELFSDYGGGVIPPGTRLMYIYQNEATVYIGLSPEFGSYDDIKGVLAMYSIVNTLSSIPDVAYVVISLNGEMNSIAGIPLDTPLLPNMSYVYNE